MIYKFENKQVGILMEVELSKADEPKQGDYDTIMFSIMYDDKNWQTKSLKKEEVADLINILQDLYKKMDNDEQD